MHRGFLISGISFAGLAVVFGAFGAHGLQDMTVDERIIHGFQTGVEYQMYHALALLAVSFVYERIPASPIKWAGGFFVIGIILFSGSLYALTIMKISGLTSAAVGIITPVGGIFFILGWLLFLIGVLRDRKH